MKSGIPPTLTNRNEISIFFDTSKNFIGHKFGHKFWLFFCLAILIFAGFSLPCFSETRYVSDVMIVMLREGPGDEYNVVASLRSDTPLEVLEETNDWVKVRAGEKEIGYMKKRYTTTDIPEPVVIERLETEIERLKSVREATGEEMVPPSEDLKKEIENLVAKSEELEEKAIGNDAEIARLAEKLRQMTSERDILKNRLENPANSDNGTANHEKENAKLKETIRHLKAKYAEFGENGLTDKLFSDGKGWMIVGGAIFFSGWLTARLSGSSRRKKYF